MAAKPRYLYFNFRARGELPRLVAAAGGVHIQDERFSMEDWVSKYKSQTPYGQAPCLVVGDKWYSQKLGISLYLARQGGLYPRSASDQEFLALDHALLYVEEVLENIVAAIVDKVIHKKPEALEKVKKETLPAKIPLLEKLLKDNGTGYYVGNKLTIVDIDAFDVMEHVLEEMGPAFLDKFPLVKANFEKVGQVEGVKKYVASRPKRPEGFEL